MRFGSLAHFTRIFTISLSVFSGLACTPGRRADQIPEPPALYEPHGHCQTLTTAANRARWLEARALAQIERYAFAPSDGIEALSLLSEAKHCFAHAKLDSDEQRVHRTLDAAARHIELDYLEHRIRLSRAIAMRRKGEARRESESLLALLEKRDGSYVSWLRRVARGLT